MGPIGGDAATREVLTALEDDLHTERAIRALERLARRAPPTTLASLAGIARTVLGIY